MAVSEPLDQDTAAAESYEDAEVVDALRGAGSKARLDMPATPERVWRALQG